MKKYWIVDNSIIPYEQSFAKKKSKEEVGWLCGQSKNPEISRLAYIFRTTSISSIPLIEIAAVALDMSTIKCEDFLRANLRINDQLFSLALFNDNDEMDEVEWAVSIFQFGFISGCDIIIPSLHFSVGHHIFNIFGTDISNKDFLVKTPRINFRKMRFSELTF